MENQVFSDLKIENMHILDAAETRSPCPKCGRSRKYFCYTCFVAVGLLQGRIPLVKLPIKVDIIKHPNERDGKSTACHAAVLANDDVTIYTFPCIPEYDRNEVILVFPGEDAVSLETLIQDQSTCGTENVNSDLNSTSEDAPKIAVHKKDDSTNNSIEHPSIGSSEENRVSDSCSRNTDVRKRKHGLDNADRQYSSIESDELDRDGAPEERVNAEPVAKKTKTKPMPTFSKVVFIDSTWKQSKTIFQDERLTDLRRVELKRHKTNFWRSQDSRPDTYLSTIEAVYYFLCDYHRLFVEEEYDGQYDNLLFFFTYMCNKIKFSNPKGKFK
ncbi:tRNA-uridine aminocarboxypropyltransferase 1-like [Gigantopelta aegis]|uniref:tRNA-uridine aminocarboxypropyltransferase 1-like n=1 Tax=Gigantopelta aegis TaxID=1735272 RepID=UPI001B88BB6E|nr:tRNA-uridine aminocarboxypropyltransferase 1-like [Gigantopelta aegis]XP_041361256.1 tRNA-uridine aminocarboxypropyltransferase 1-like [Gigantopelta aegis]